MGKLLLAAFLGGVLGALVTYFTIATLVGNERRSEMDARLARTEERIQAAEDRADIAAKRSELLQRRLDTTTRDVMQSISGVERTLASRAETAAPGAAAAAAPGAVAPDGTPYVSRAELEEAMSKARTRGGVVVPGAAEPAKTLEQIAQEMGLSASEEAEARTILRSSEEEAVRCLFGDRPLKEIGDEIRAAKDDPDKMEALVGETMGRAFSNLGKLATLEGRTRKRMEGALGKERAADLMRRPHVPVLGPEFEQIFEGVDLR